MNLAKLLDLDEKLSSRLKIIDTDHFLRPLAIIFAHSGDSWLWLIGLGIIVLFGAPGWQYKALAMTASFIFLAFIVLAIKFTVRRKRPEGDWGQMYRATDPHSFPSGHAARAFLFAVLSVGLGPLWLAVLLCLWAPLVSLARVGTGVHYLSDILAGMFVGIFAGVIVLQLLPILHPWFVWALDLISRFI